MKARDLDALSKLVGEFKKDYKESIFKLTRTNPVFNLFGDARWNYVTEEESKVINGFFIDLIGYESKAYFSEKKYIKQLNQKDSLRHELENYTWKYAVVDKTLIILYGYCAIDEYNQGSLGMSACFVFLSVVLIVFHKKTVEKEKMREMFKDLKD
jgi:lipid-A-disaccharide synthase-like uncharacterized protein